MPEALLSVDHAHLSFAGLSVLQDVSLRIEERQIVTLIGPNGAGKTSLVRAALGLQALDSGRIERRPDLKIGYMPQRLAVSDTMPIAVQDFLALRGHGQDHIDQALADAAISELSSTPLRKVSGGELQRVLLARALLQDPQLLVLDEPVQGVDLNGQAELYELIGEVRRQRQCAVLLVSHDLNVVMAKTDTVVCLNRHICCQGHPDHVSSDPAFQELFGASYADKLAVYHHHHDHEHDVHGNVVRDSRGH